MPSQNVPHHHKANNADADGGAPIDQRVSEKEVLDNVVIPATHAKANVQNGPLPPLRGKVVLLVRVGNQSIVGCHHGNVEMNEVVKERRLVDTRVTGRQFVVPVGLNVPVGVCITRVVLLGAGNLDLLETPLRKVFIGALQIATQNFVLEAESRGQSADSAAVPGCNVSDNLNLPVIFFIADSKVAVGRDFLVALGHWRSDVVGVQVTSGLGVDQTDDGTVADESKIRGLGVVVRLPAVGIEEPVVVGILVMVASDLLLLRTFRVCLDVGVKQTATITHIFDSSTRAVGNF